MHDNLTVCSLARPASYVLQYSDYDLGWAPFWAFQVLRFWCFEVLMFWGFEVMKFWGSEVLRFWGYEVLRFWGFEVLRSWGFEVLRSWGFEILRFWGFKVLRLWGFEVPFYTCKFLFWLDTMIDAPRESQTQILFSISLDSLF